MGPAIVHLEQTLTPRRLDRAIEGLLIALLAFMPLAFGAVEAWSEQVVTMTVAAMALLLAVKLLLDTGSRFVWSWTYLPIGLFVLLVLLQLVPLPADVVAAISPQTAALKADLLGDLPEAGTQSALTLTFYPHASLHQLRLVLAAAAVFIVVVNVYRTPAQVQRLLTAVACIGGAVALIALGQNLSGTEAIYGMFPAAHLGAGPFANYSHFSQFMNLSIGACLGLVLLRLHQWHDQPVRSMADLRRQMGRVEMHPVWLLIGVMIVAALAIFLSLSRGGMLSLIAATVFTGIALGRNQRLAARGWILVLFALGAFALLLHLGFNTVYDRLATMRGLEANDGGRWQILTNLAGAWRQFPVFGTGLGTHEVIYPMFDRPGEGVLSTHAENEYAQMMLEVGGLGLAIILAFLAMIWSCWIRAVRRLSLPTHTSAYGLAFGLVAVLLHSFTDFGQHVPAVALLTATVCGLIVVLSRMSAAAHEDEFGQPTPAANPSLTRRFRGGAALAAVLLVAGWACLEANAARLAEDHWYESLRIEQHLAAEGWQGEPEPFIDLIAHAEQATRYRPANAEYQHWLNVYRWYAISRHRDPETGNVLLSDSGLDHTRRIVDELHQVRLLCPTFGPSYSMAGQLELFVLGRPHGATLIHRGFELARYDPLTAFVAGQLAAEEGDWSLSLARFRAAGGRHADEAIDLYLAADRPDLAIALAQESPGRLMSIARRFEREDTGEAYIWADRARQQARALLEARRDEGSLRPYQLVQLARLYANAGETEAAIASYRQALASDYGQPGWHLNLAELLAENREFEQAIRHARISLRLRPQGERAKGLIADWSMEPAVAERHR